MNNVARTLWQDRGMATWLRRVDETAYFGWVNRGNIGDDSMYLAHAGMNRSLPLAPLHKASRVFISHRSIKRLVIGGGTLVFRDEWADRLNALLSRCPSTQLYYYGVGCEDPDFALSSGVASRRGIAEWRRLLERAQIVGVRGPRSVEYLNSLDIPATIVGDPALNIRGPSHGPRLSTRTGVKRYDVLVNLAAVSDGYSIKQHRTVSDYISLAQSRGLRCAFIAMERDDAKLARTTLPRNLDVLRPRSPAEAISFIEKSNMVLSERLHCNILACALGVPFVALGYKPKVTDFASSIDSESLVIDTRDITLESLEYAVDSSTTSWTRQRDHLCDTFRRNYPR